ncbi:MAG TPA: response regulator transcription factor [Chitinophagaceae bacterium]|nr:response regulator transcription factor [Chitinophagaceae bacterium]
MDQIKIAIVDDQRLFRDGLAALLKSVPEFALTAVWENGRDCIDQLPGLPITPQVLLVDMNMPEMNGVELTTILQKKYPAIRIIILTVYEQERFIFKMIEAGASAYLLKNSETEEVIHAIRTVYRSGYYFNETVVQVMKNGSRKPLPALRNSNNIPIELTGREKEVLLLICKELTNTEIASHLYISTRTVDGHRNNLLAKTGARNTAGLVLFAVSNGLLDILPQH